MLRETEKKMTAMKGVRWERNGKRVTDVDALGKKMTGRGFRDSSTPMCMSEKRKEGDGTILLLPRSSSGNVRK